MTKNFLFIMLLVAITTPLIGYASDNSTTTTQQDITKSKTKPLYWVDPMEPNVRYSAPGKSRMGMTLVPVYPKQDQNTNQNVIPTAPPKE